MGPGETMSTLIAIILPSLLIFYFAKRFFQLKEKAVTPFLRPDMVGRYLPSTAALRGGKRLSCWRKRKECR